MTPIYFLFLENILHSSIACEKYRGSMYPKIYTYIFAICIRIYIYLSCVYNMCIFLPQKRFVSIMLVALVGNCHISTEYLACDKKKHSRECLNSLGLQWLFKTRRILRKIFLQTLWTMMELSSCAVREAHASRHKWTPN